MGLDHPLAQAVLQEVSDLHAFFEAWLSGEAENTNAVFTRVESSLGEEFTMVSPSGQRLQRPDVIGWLRGTHGARASQRTRCPPSSETSNRAVDWRRVTTLPTVCSST